MVTFSVIVNNYNYLWCLPQAVESVAAQSYRDFELIVVDDGSNDGSVDYLRSLGERIALIETPRLRQARACLTALRAAKGRYIYFLDADDFIAADALEIASRSVHGDPSKIQFKLQPVDEQGAPMGAPWPAFPPGYNRESIIAEIVKTGAYVSPPTSGNIFRRDVLERISDVSYEHVIDGVSLLLAPFLGDVVTLPDVLGYYRVHGNSFSQHGAANIETIRRDRHRFDNRLAHLAELAPDFAILRAKRTRDPYFFTLDQLSMERVLTGQGCSPAFAFRYLRQLLAERGLSAYTLRKLAWLGAAALAPPSVAQNLAARRRTPWGFKLSGAPRAAPSSQSPRA